LTLIPLAATSEPPVSDWEGYTGKTMDQNQGQRRGHFHRGRRGSDRRGLDRRTQPAPQPERGSGNQVDVEQIMREIRGRIAQRQGIELSNQQIQDLAARRLESILDPRAVKPSLLEAMRRTAGAQAQRAAEKVPNEPAFSFEDTTIYDSHRGLMRFIRRLLNPLLKLFFNPNPLIRALHIQAKLNVEAAERDAERDRRQTEWNALHYEIVQRLVTEVSRASLELQALSLRIESLDAKVEFNERRVRAMEGSAHRARPQTGPARPAEPQPAVAISTVEAEPAPQADTQTAAAAEGPHTSEGARRRRRRRRGRRSGTGSGEASSTTGGHRPEPMPDEADARLAGPPTEQLPDTGIVESPPVPYEQAAAPTPFQHSAPIPPEHPAPFEHPVPTAIESPAQAPPPAIGSAPIVAAESEPPPAPAPSAQGDPEPQPAPDPERHEY
jgi:hypothetical protein